jgi:hypothetical protein
MALKAAIGNRRRQRPGPQQMDLFKPGSAGVGVGAPAWPDLPRDARESLVGLMTQLILGHVRTTEVPSAAAESGDDR